MATFVYLLVNLWKEGWSRLLFLFYFKRTWWLFYKIYVKFYIYVNLFSLKAKFNLQLCTIINPSPKVALSCQSVLQGLRVTERNRYSREIQWDPRRRGTCVVLARVLANQQFHASFANIHSKPFHLLSVTSLIIYREGRQDEYTCQNCGNWKWGKFDWDSRLIQRFSHV